MSDPTQQAFNFKPRARKSDPATSHAACKSITPQAVSRSQEIVLALLKRFGMLTDAQLETHAREEGVVISPSRLRTARKELVRLGFVADSGIVRPVSSKTKGIVWKDVR